MPQTHASPHNTGERDSTHRRREESRERLLAAAEDQLREEELEYFSVQSVVERAGESVGTFYRIFHGKQALLLAVQNRLHDRVEPRILDALKRAQATHASLEDAVDHAFTILIDNVMSETQLFRAFALFGTFDPAMRSTSRMHHIARRDAIMALLEEHRDEIRHPDPDQAIRHAYHLYFAAMHGRLMFLRPGAGPVFGVGNEVFFDQLKLSIRNLLLGTTRV